MLMDGRRPKILVADKGYDSDALLHHLWIGNAKAIVPPKSNRLRQREYDKGLYKERNRIERLFGKLKRNRRIGTRYDKHDVSYLGFVLLGAILVWLADFVDAAYLPARLTCIPSHEDGNGLAGPHLAHIETAAAEIEDGIALLFLGMKDLRVKRVVDELPFPSRGRNPRMVKDAKVVGNGT